MARSGTTFAIHLLSQSKNVRTEVEPHALWRRGNFKFLNDEDYEVHPKITASIRASFLDKLEKDQVLIEKSPINSLRPKLVHAVFPEAKIVYLERDPVRCIYSNYQRSETKDSFKLSIILKKYLWYTGSEDLPGAISKRKIWQQIQVKDYLDFFVYSWKMFRLRKKNKLPFGPKIKDFDKIVTEHDLLGYHVMVYRKSQYYKARYKELFKQNMATFSMEKLMTEKNELSRLFEFCEFNFDDVFLKRISASLDDKRKEKALKAGPLDSEIQDLLKKHSQ
ncbi:MAG: sulfotransferase [Flavobacteriales bacterium]|nr:sulfotransferase [Flavobacteriales bacterium]